MNRFKSFVMVVASLVVSLSAVAQSDLSWSAAVEMQTASKGVVVVDARPSMGYHFYAFAPEGGYNSTQLEIVAQEGVEVLGAPQASVAPTKVFEESFGEFVSHWASNVKFTIPFQINDGKNHNLTIRMWWQSCTDQQRCLAPQEKTINVVANYAMPGLPADEAKAPAVAEDSPKGKETAESSAEPVVATPVAEAAATDLAVTEPLKISNDSAAASVPASSVSVSPELRQSWWAPVETVAPTTNHTPWGILIIGFIGGLAALLTPCVWPLIPMTLSFFLKKTKGKSRVNKDAFVYGLSIVVIYVALGLVITAIFGAGKLNEISTSAVFNIFLFLVLVVFAFSFLGAFDIKLPESWSNALDSKAEKTSGLLSIFFMAFTLAIVSFSCTGPIIGTLLVEAAAEGNILGPALGMGGFALGLALPFTLCAIFPSMLNSMPKSGGWLNSVKVVLGFIELILALKFLSVADMAYGWRLLDREVFISLWVVLFVLLGMYLLGKISFSHDEKVEKIGVLRFTLALFPLSFAVYLVPGLWGAPLNAASAFVPPLTTQDFNLNQPKEYTHFTDYDEGMAYAKQHNQPVLIDFSGFGCVNCRNMESAVFNTDPVLDVVGDNFVVITLMVDDRSKLKAPVSVVENGETKELDTAGEMWTYLQSSKFGASTQPYYIVLDNEGNAMNNPVSFTNDDGSRVSVNQFIEWLHEGINNYKD